MSWPAGLPAGVEVATPALMMDLLPTVLEAVDGAQLNDPNIDGRSQLENLRGGESAQDRCLFWEYEGQLAVRRGRWKLVLDARESMTPGVAVPRGLFDLDDDPAETTDLSAQHAGLAGELEGLRRWAAICDDQRRRRR